MTAIEFLRRYRPNSLVKSSARGEYQLAEHDSFKINGESSVWHWKSRDIGGKSALKYLIYVEGVPFVEAVQLLCEESPMYIPVQHEAVERERPLFRLPNPAPNNDRVTRYLLGRGISLPTIRYCIARKILYESAEYHNCVFLGKDPQGVPKYAALRGIYDYGKPFKREAPGSQKQYGFCIPPMQPGTTVAVFEAAIDAMAEMTLCGDAADKYRLSLGGVSSSGKEPLALQEFLRQHPEITTIELRLDNDAKGRMASVGIRKIYADRYTVHDLPPNIENGDYADMAKNNLMARTAAHRAVLADREKNMKIHNSFAHPWVTGGNEMAVFRVQKTQNYTIMSNHHLRNKALSLKAKGLLSLMLSLPEDWDYTTRGLASICKEGVDSVCATVRELEAAGYIIRRRIRDKNGQMRGMEYTVLEQPQPPEQGPEEATPKCAQPKQAKPKREKPVQANPAQLNTKEIKKEETNNVSNPIRAAGQRAEYRALLLKNIEYPILAQNNPMDTMRLDELVELMLDVVCSKRAAIRISGEEMPAEVVKSRFLKLGAEHIQYVLDCLKDNPPRIRTSSNTYWRRFTMRR